MKVIKLQTAVALAIQELLKLGGFSAYEVTTLVRQRVDNDYYISDCEVESSDSDPSSNPITQIKHADVRAIVNELHDNGLFEASKGHDSSNGRAFIVYKPLCSANTGAPNTVVVNHAPVTAQTVTNDIVRKVYAYITNNNGGTIQRIHSSLKTKGLTCRDIAKLLGFSANLDAPSKLFVRPTDIAK